METNIEIGSVRVSPRPLNQTTAVLGAADQVGDAVTFTAANTFGRGADTNVFHGVVLSKEQDNLGTVARGGRLLVKAAATLGPGSLKNLTVDGAGKVKSGVGTDWLILGEETIDSQIYALVERR